MDSVVEGSDTTHFLKSKFFEVEIIPWLSRKVKNLQLIRETLFISLDIYSLGSERPQKVQTEYLLNLV